MNERSKEPKTPNVSMLSLTAQGNKELEAAKREIRELQSEVESLRHQLAISERVTLAQFREAGVWEPDGSKFRTYRRESLNGRPMYVREPQDGPPLPGDLSAVRQ
ncbi:hypothetical protein QCE49_29085 [Caballeronia sp. LZ008]|uniref:hypothetical protein n=1 Tax=unclassified Caballeronia TaxID=2646786 RepID=UPI002027BB72|nr:MULTISPECIES: hypothetical protein [unclassified Caballeronia]MDR5797458.1 hypothetical protein [Caballeronia sp. LZ008]